MESWESMLSQKKDTDNTGEVKKKAKKGKTATDLIIAKNPKNPYPIYQMMIKSDNFAKETLYSAHELLSGADRRLKSTGQSPKLILEEVIINICQ